MLKSKYTPEINDFIKSNSKLSRKDLTKKLNDNFDTDFNVNQIKAQASRLGALCGQSGRFERGITVWNKGTKGLMPVQKTAFKKGNIPHNNATVGFESQTTNGFIYIKAEANKPMVLKHVYLWEQVNGKIPKGHVLLFKDGNRSNCTLDNLMIATKREVLVMNRRYREINKPQFRETVALLSKLHIKTLEVRNV